MKINSLDDPDPHNFHIDISSIRFDIHTNNTPATIFHLPSDFKLIGIGTDAIVVQHVQQPDVVYKVFGHEAIDKLHMEYEAYQHLQSSPYFPACYDKKENYLILSYEPGPTLYECLEKGIVIPDQVIKDVEQSIQYAKKCGLYPQDIHLKNIILQDGHAKVIDIASYLTPGQDDRWNHLVTGYYQIYPFIKGKKIPTFIIDKVKRMYFSSHQNINSILKYLEEILGR